MPNPTRSQHRVLAALDSSSAELLDFAQQLIRIPTINPPGNCYPEAAELVGDRLQQLGFEIQSWPPVGRPEHSDEHPRANVVGLCRGLSERPLLHFNGHLDVVPPGDGWTYDPFGGLIENGRLYGRGSADMKAGLAAAVFAAAALRRAGIEIEGSLEISATADEESGGFAGAAWLAEQGVLSAERVDHVIIPEPFGPDRICLGHRGVYWFKIESQGAIGHGSMPFLGINAIEQLTPLLEAFRTRLEPEIARRRTEMPVVPPEARRATLNINAIQGGQAGLDPQTPCVADRCEVILDRRFLPEEGFEATKREIEELVREVAAEDDRRNYTIEDLMVVQPVYTPADSKLVAALRRAVESIRGGDATLVASPGTYDHKHVTGIGGITDCVAYGPGELELAHQPDESCSIDDLVASAKVMALAALELVAPNSL